MLKKKFGTIAIKEGYITPEQLKEAFAYQLEMEIKEGSSNPIGEILLHLGYIDRAQINEILAQLTEQESKAYLEERKKGHKDAARPTKIIRGINSNAKFGVLHHPKKNRIWKFE